MADAHVVFAVQFDREESGWGGAVIPNRRCTGITALNAVLRLQ